MKWRQLEFLAERFIPQIHCFDKFTGLYCRLALPEYPWYELEGCDVHLVFRIFLISCLVREIQSGHAEALLIGGIEIQWISIRYEGHTYHRVMFLINVPVPVSERKSPRSNHNLLTE